MTLPKDMWIECHSGTRFTPLNPQPQDVKLIDIAHHLSRLNRYNGAIKLEHYSVAEHSVVLALWLLKEYKDPFLAYQGLMHDATEAYIGDMVRPLKAFMPSFTEAEERLWIAIVQSCPLLLTSGTTLDPLVVEADHRILVDERAQVMNPSNNDWGMGDIIPLGANLHGWSPNVARNRFLDVAFMLRKFCQKEMS
jgi:hypothetical protein